MDQSLLTFFQTQGPWALLFVALFLWTIKDNKVFRKDSRDREDKLMAHNDGYQKALGDLSSGQQRLADAITDIRKDVNDLRVDVAEIKRG